MIEVLPTHNAHPSHAAATPDLFVGCLLHYIPLRSPFCR